MLEIKYKQPKIAILGLGYYQRALISEAKEMGIFPIIFSGKTNIYHTQYEKIYNIPIYESKKILDICILEKIDGICSIASEKAVQTIGLVNESMHLRGISKKIAELFTNKISIKKLFQALKIKTPDFYVGFFSETQESIEEKCLLLRFPVIFKPVDNSHSKGIIKIHSIDEITDGIKYVSFHTSKDRFIIEKFIDGVSFGIETITTDARTFVLIVGNISSGGEIDVPIGHYTPMEGMGKNTLRQVLKNVKKIISESKINNTLTTIDCRLSNEGEVFFLEVGVRCGGIMIPEIISINFGINIYEMILKLAIGHGNTVKIKRTGLATAASLIYSKTEGYISNVINNNPQHSWLECSIDYQPEQKVYSYQSNPSQIGRIIVTGNSKIEALQRLWEAIDRVSIITLSNTAK